MYTQRLQRPLRVLVDPDASDAARILARAEADLYARRRGAGEKVETLMTKLRRLMTPRKKQRRA